MEAKKRRISTKALIHWLPGLKLISSYQRVWLGADLLAGVTVFAILVPQAMAYGDLAGLEPVTGLYAAIAAMLAYVVFGPSRLLMMGPESSVAIFIATALGSLMVGSNAQAAALAGMIALLAGLLGVLAGMLRIGFLADFVSKPVLVGYLNGVSFIIIASQLGKLFGITTEGENFFPKIWSLLTQLPKTNFFTLGCGLTLIGFLLLLKRLLPKAPGSLIVVVIMTLATALLHLDRYGLKVVGAIPAGVPLPSLPLVPWGDIMHLLPTSLAVMFIAFADTVLTARAFAQKHQETTDANQELLALGACNLLVGLFQGFPITCSQSRTVVDEGSGGKTQLVGLVASILTILFLLFFTPLLQTLPEVALAAIVVVAAIGLFEPEPVKKMFQIRPSEGVLAILATVGVLALGLLPGMLLTIIIALLLMIKRLTCPYDAVLGSIEGKDGYHALDQDEGGKAIAGLLIYRFGAPLFFANAQNFADQVMKRYAEEKQPVKEVLLDAAAISDIDVTAADALDQLYSQLQQRGTKLAFARVTSPVRETLQRSGLLQRIGKEYFFPSVRNGVQAFLADQR